MPGYWNNPIATQKEFTGGFWHSGDLGSTDPDGFVSVLDRKKDMLNRGGHKIYTAEVEAVLAAHEEVVESAVVGRPCPVLGERVHAYIVTRSAGTLPASLRRYLAGRLSDYKVPETMHLSTEPLPRNSNGKRPKRIWRNSKPIWRHAKRRRPRSGKSRSCKRRGPRLRPSCSKSRDSFSAFRRRGKPRKGKSHHFEPNRLKPRKSNAK